MNAMRSLLLVLCLGFCLTACGAAPVKPPSDVLGQLDQAEVVYSSAQSAAQAASDQAKLKQREAEAADAARTRAAQALAGSLAQAAQVREAQAREYKERMCKIDPGRCSAPVPASPRADASSQSPSKAEYVDVKVASFCDGGISRLTIYPDGWRIKYVPSKFVLVIDGQDKKELPEDASAVGGCFRVSELGFSRMECPPK